MRQRKDGLWEDTIPRIGLSPKHFYGKTKAEVKAKIANWEAAQESGEVFSSYISSWLRSKEAEVTYKTLEGYQAPVKRILAVFGNEKIKDITPAEIQAFVNSISKRGYKRTTVQRPLDIMRMVFDFAITQPGSTVTYNPCNAIRLPSGLEQEHRELADPDDIRRIKDSVNEEFGLFAYFLLFSGLRKAEALAITDADIHDGRIWVTKALSWQPNQPVIKAPKTSKSIRSVILLDALAEKLPKFKGYLFSGDGGNNPLSQTEFRHRWAAYCKAAGISDVVPHQLRHEFATMCFDAGLEAMDTKELMGHASINTTEAIYTHIRNSRRESSENKLNILIKKLS